MLPAFRREPAHLPWGSPTRLYIKVMHKTKALFSTRVHSISDIDRNVILSPGDVISKTKGEEEQFSSISDQYQESYFHPLIMTGTVKSSMKLNRPSFHLNLWCKRNSSLTPIRSLSPHLKSFCLPAAGCSPKRQSYAGVWLLHLYPPQRRRQRRCERKQRFYRNKNITKILKKKKKTSGALKPRVRG